MPTNLPPEYFAAEKEYKSAVELEDKISSLENLISTIPKHKGTDKLRADLRRRLSKMKDTSQAIKKKGKHDSAWHIEKEGAGRVAIIGAPNVGKSALISALTHATPKVSEYPMTTWIPTPGMMQFEDIQIQLVDTPALSKEHSESELFNLIKISNLVLLLIDLQGFPFEQLEDSLEILEKHWIAPLQRKDKYIDNPNMTLIPFVLVINKNDYQNFNEDYNVFCELLEEQYTKLHVSAHSKNNLENLKKLIFEKLEIMRIYSKKPGKPPEMDSPFVLKKGSNLKEFAAKVHKDFLQNFKSARIWGKDVFDGQLVGRDHILFDGDVVELHI
jgi:ribosome-interacting GTPase 1